MHNAQRILLAVSCLSCFALLKYCWTADMLTGELLVQRHGRLHVDIDGFVTCDRPVDTAVNHIQQAPTVPINHETHCADLDGINDLAIILKTGSTEIYEKLPIHFVTTFLCVKDRLIYSDIQQYFSGESVRDALILLSQGSRDERSDLEQHASLNEHVRLSGDAAELKGEKSWQIDKWKFLPMISDSYATFGDSKKWYFFIEADTYVSLHNMLPWLAMLDHKQAIYAGAQVMIDQTEFGHGGSGFLLSSSAAKALSDVYHSDKTRWESVIAADCCGDKVMAEVLQAANPPVRLLRAFPQITPPASTSSGSSTSAGEHSTASTPPSCSETITPLLSIRTSSPPTAHSQTGTTSAMNGRSPPPTKTRLPYQRRRASAFAKTTRLACSGLGDLALARRGVRCVLAGR